MALNGRAARWFKNTFGRPKAPKAPASAPTAAQLYTGPQAYSGFRPQAAQATGDASGLDQARSSMTGLADLGRTGWTDTGRGQYESMLRRGQQASAATRQAALQGAQARGTAQGGAGLLAGLSGGQQDANAAADAAVGFAAQGEQNRMGAQQAAGSLGMGLDAQRFGQSLQTGAAQDAFDTGAADRQSAATQQEFSNQMALYQAAMDRYNAQMEQRAARWSAALGGITGGATAIASAARKER